MGCCGCSLYGSTVTAGLLTLLDCVLFLTFDIAILVFIGTNENLDTGSNKEFHIFVSGFNLDHETHITVLILLGIKVGLRIAWLLSAVLLLVGNAREFRKFLNVWKYLTVSRIVYTIGTSIYALVKFMDDMEKLFKNYQWKLEAGTDNRYVAEFTILLDFVELGPIWLIVLIALVIFVHQRSNEIETKKGQMSNVNHWGNFANAKTNGSARNGTGLSRATSLTREPTPFTIAEQNNNSNEPKRLSQLERTHIPLEPISETKTTTNESLKPVLQINEVISIPRVRLNPNKVKSKVQTFDSISFDTSHQNKRHISSLAKRSSYFEHQRDQREPRDTRDPSKVPQRNHSYNLAQNSGERVRHSYDNRGFDYKTERDLNNPVLIKRASTRRSQNQ